MVATRDGDPDVLVIVERPEPEVGPRDVLVCHGVMAATNGTLRLSATA